VVGEVVGAPAGEGGALDEGAVVLRPVAHAVVGLGGVGCAFGCSFFAFRGVKRIPDRPTAPDLCTKAPIVNNCSTVSDSLHAESVSQFLGAYTNRVGKVHELPPPPAGSPRFARGTARGFGSPCSQGEP
jgi:hypothetical protein